MVTPHTLASDEAAAKQLAEAFNESLEFLILLNEVIPGGDPLALPEWCLLLGTTYTTNDVSCYAHCPRFDMRGDKHWEFRSKVIGKWVGIQLGRGTIQTQAALVYPFLMMQRNLHEVVQGLSGWMRDYGEIFREHGLIAKPLRLAFLHEYQFEASFPFWKHDVILHSLPKSPGQSELKAIPFWEMPVGNESDVIVQSVLVNPS
jgi:hypothetical protein